MENLIRQQPDEISILESRVAVAAEGK